MLPTTSYRFGEVVLVPFPFTDQTGMKKRPAIVVSTAAYQARRQDLIIMAVTSRKGTAPVFGEFPVLEGRRPVCSFPRLRSTSWLRSRSGSFSGSSARSSRPT